MSWLENQFKLTENRSSVRTELAAGLTTFMAMAYIIVVNPGILSESGMPFGPVLVATCVGAAVGCFLMGFLANYPFALAPGMGLNAFFTYSVVMTMHVPWHVALTAVFVEGVIFLLLTFTNIREKVVNTIPLNMKIGISAGIGLFIAFIGLKSAGIVVSNPATSVGLGNLKSVEALLALFGLFLMVLLHIRRVRGSILIGIVAVTLLGIPLGVTKMPESFMSMPPSLEPILFKLDFSQLLTTGFWVVVIAFFFVDFFDTVGTLVGCASRGGMLNEKGELPRARPALFSDAIATIAGACLGTSTVTTYVESATGIEEGGRTGLTAIVCGVLFLLAVFFYPLFVVVPACATAPALIMVGAFMMMGLDQLDFSDWTEGFPAILAMFMMPLGYSISVGIEFAVVSYVVLKLLTGRAREVSWLMGIMAAAFILNRCFM
ncbi:MAG: NCS2 family permease [Sutterella sp.]|nr:NCS2 family permease [Sutterella sp.]